MAVQRVSRTDVTELATETRAAPRQIAAVLRLESPMPAPAVVRLLGDRVSRVPRLRQRLRKPPVGLGRPMWVDDAGFDVNRHVERCLVEAPASEAAALQVAASAAVTPLKRGRPLWTASLVTDAEGRCHAVVLVLHHVLIDGIGGLAALGELLSAAPAEPTVFPLMGPSASEVWRDVVASRLRALRSMPEALRSLGAAVCELRGGPSRPVGRHHSAAHSSLNRPIGPRRQLATARVALPETVAAAHRYGATVNDLLLTAIAGALSAVLRGRGETVDRFVVSVPVSGRRADDPPSPGNQVGVIPVAVPTLGTAVERLSTIAGITRAGRQTIGRGASAVLLGAVFRALARLGLFAWFVDHQRLVNTFVTNLHGPRDPLFLGDEAISDIIAISPIAGNITVAFAALSYVDTLTITVIADPATCPEVSALARALQQELQEVIRAPAPDPSAGAAG